MKTTFSQKLLGLCLLAGAMNVNAGVVVISNPKVGLTSLTQDDVSRIFLAKTKTYPNNATAVPVNQNEGSPMRAAFEEKVLKKTPSQVNAYWTQLIFTGKGTPPKDVGGDAEVKKLVAENPDSIGYIDSASIDATVIVVYRVE